MPDYSGKFIYGVTGSPTAYTGRNVTRIRYRPVYQYRSDWKRVDGAKKYIVYVGRWNEKKLKGTNWKKVKTVDQKKNAIITASIKKYNGKAFQKNKYYVYKVVTVSGAGKSADVYRSKKAYGFFYRGKAWSDKKIFYRVTMSAYKTTDDRTVGNDITRAWGLS